LKNFVKRWLSEEEPEAVKAHLPQGQRIYCIGDIHGRLDLLQQLHESVLQDAATCEANKTLIYLGDYIDRGEQSKEVIDLLLEAPLEGFDTVHLLGNHEQTLLDFLQHPNAVGSWLTFGGRATLHSYGVVVSPEYSRQNLDDLRDGLAHRLPPSHLQFYQNLKVMHLAGSYCFVHAGVRPGIPLQEQRNEDLLWIRDDFTRSTATHEHIVVHGHTISEQPEFRPNRIGIDTAAYQSGVLTCLVLEGEEQRLIQTNVGASHARD
jgi:serine/threonine protein phosphatase 1